MPVQLNGSNAYLRHDFSSPSTMGYPQTQVGYYLVTGGNGFGVTTTSPTVAGGLIGAWFEPGGPHLYNYRQSSAGGSSDDLTTEVAEYVGPTLVPLMLVAVNAELHILFTPNYPTGRAFNPDSGSDVPADIAALSSLVAGCFYRNNSTALFFQGHLAEVGLAPQALGEEEYAQILADVPMETIAGVSWYGVWPLLAYEADGTYADLISGKVLTAFGGVSASAIDHPVTRSGGGGGDTTAPVLTSPVATSTGSTTGTLGASTDEANGTMYFVGTGSTTVPSKAQVKAGQDHTSTLLDSGRRPTLAITSTGAKSVGLTGLSASTTYHGYAMHEDAAGNQSDVLYLGSFTTAAPNTPPTFPGPNIADQTAKRGQNIGTLDVSGRFSDSDALTFSAIGSWPAGVTISSAGVITRAPSAVPATYSGLQVRATDTGGNTQDSNAFSFTVQQCVLALNSAGYEIGDGNSAATMAVLASTSLNIAAYPASEWPPSTLLASATASTDTAGRLANLGDDDFIFGTLYQVLLRNPADGERWIWTMQAS